MMTRAFQGVPCLAAPAGTVARAILFPEGYQSLKSKHVFTIDIDLGNEYHVYYVFTVFIIRLI
jgi:hypothetical protein